jgi:hypothetical protein
MQVDDTRSWQATFRPADGIVWAVQSAGLLVVDEVAGRTLELGYPEAASWDLLTQGRTLQQIGERLRFVLDDPCEDAENLVRVQTRRWLEDGWIVAAGAPPGKAEKQRPHSGTPG